MKLLKFFLILVISTGMFSCDDDDNGNGNGGGSNVVTFKATLNGANERPDPVTTSATGQATLVYNKGTKKFAITVTFTGISPTMGHIHEGATDVAGPVVFGLFSAPTSSPVYYTTPDALTTDQETKLMSNGYYVNLHSEAYPGGEIRGQLMKQSSSSGGSGGGDPY